MEGTSRERQRENGFSNGQGTSSARKRYSARPALQQGHRIHGGGTGCAEAPRTFAATRFHPKGTEEPRARQLPAQELGSRKAHFHGGSSGQERTPLLPHRDRQFHGNAADHLHADRRGSMPPVRPHLPPSARTLRVVG